MNKSRLLGAVCTCIIITISIVVQAVEICGQGTWETTLQGRDLDGDAATVEAYYDTVLDITWLADANVNSSMAWGDANKRAGTTHICRSVFQPGRQLCTVADITGLDPDR